MEDPQEKAFVWLLKEDSMTVHKTMITAGEITGSENIVVLDGLKAGEKIATSGITKLQDGMKVRIWEE
jgi:multidrug efflux pump subunit AcrA (membrane-fusion protein)